MSVMQTGNVQSPMMDLGTHAIVTPPNEVIEKLVDPAGTFSYTVINGGYIVRTLACSLDKFHSLYTPLMFSKTKSDRDVMRVITEFEERLEKGDSSATERLKQVADLPSFLYVTGQAESKQ